MSTSAAQNYQNTLRNALSGITAQKSSDAQAGAKVLPGLKLQIESNIEAVQQQLDSFAEKLEAISQKNFEIKITLPSTEEFTQSLTTLFKTTSDQGQLTQLNSALSELSKHLQEINANKMTNVLSGLNMTDASTKKLEELPTKIEAIATALNNLPKDSSQFLSGIQNILQNAKALENLVKALNAKPSNMSAVSGAAGGNKPMTPKQLSN
jgi:chromosome segregation ATPase